MLGALDPNRIAAASCPEPTKTVVFGAETEAGVFVCRKLIAERHYAITALTVDDQCAEAQELRDHGIRVVSVDMDNPGSYAKELAGAKAVYLSSNGE
jgi:saccharopine dehydrogenase-like NADP-dependent oxidoreductase